MNAPISVADAPLPTTYERAKTALAECARIDECQDWADKAAAIAAYARMADDDAMYRDAIRIRSRAIMRCSELLKPLSRPGARTDLEPAEDSSVGFRSAKDAASRAGLSDHDLKTAQRIGRIPKDEFERLVESDDPPTVNALAEMGRRREWEVDEHLRPLFSAVSHLARLILESEYYIRPEEHPIFAANMRRIVGWWSTCDG